jgi:hypothetical protein
VKAREVLDARGMTTVPARRLAPALLAATTACSFSPGFVREAPTWDVSPFSRSTLSVGMRDPGQVALVAEDGRVVVPRGAGASEGGRIDPRATAMRDASGALVVGWDEIRDARGSHQVALSTDALLVFSFGSRRAAEATQAAVASPQLLAGDTYDLPVELAYTVQSTRAGPRYGMSVTVPCRHAGDVCVHLVTPRSNLIEVRAVTTYDRYIEDHNFNYRDSGRPPDRDVLLYPGAR